MNNAHNYNILFCGVGGQGVLTAAEICGVAAMLAGHHVKKSEVHGMAQRGGSVESHLRFGKDIFSPLIMPGQADFIVSFFPAEGVRLKDYLKTDGIHFNDVLAKVDRSTLDQRFLNTYLLGVLSAFLPMGEEHWGTALRQQFSKFQDENQAVFLRGRNDKRKYYA
jgi:indolepyruvate ferredoxin oxidoreductase beta subunit